MSFGDKNILNYSRLIHKQINNLTQLGTVWVRIDAVSLWMCRVVRLNEYSSRVHSMKTAHGVRAPATTSHQTALPCVQQRRYTGSEWTVGWVVALLARNAFAPLSLMDLGKVSVQTNTVLKKIVRSYTTSWNFIWTWTPS